MPNNRSTARLTDTLAETGSYRVSVHAGETGRLIREYSMDDEAVSADRFKEVELEARARLASRRFTEIVLVITLEAPGLFKQLQLELSQAGS